MLTITFFACNPRHRLTNALSCGMKVLLNDWNQFAENLSASLMNIVQGLSYLGFPLIKIIFVGMRFPLLLGPLERNTTVSTFSLLNSCCELHGDWNGKLDDGGGKMSICCRTRSGKRDRESSSSLSSSSSSSSSSSGRSALNFSEICTPPPLSQTAVTWLCWKLLSLARYFKGHIRDKF